MDQDKSEHKDERVQDTVTTGQAMREYKTPVLVELGRVEAMTAGSASFYIG